MSKPLTLTFPGQGSQAIGMGKELAAQYSCAADVFKQVDDALGEKLSELMWDGTTEELTLTQNAQPALMAVSLAAMKVLEEEGLSIEQNVECVAGHSLGEYSALAAVGTLSITDAARLLRIRGKAMQDAVPVGEGAMAAILGLSLEDVNEVAENAQQGEVCDIANDNSDGQVVISGRKAAVERAIDIAKSKGAKRALLLPVSAPFHCTMMQPAAEIMSEALSSVEFMPPKVPVYVNVLASPIVDTRDIRDRLVEQVTGMVRWRETMAAMAEDGITQQLEVGSGKVLAGLTRRIAKSIQAKAFGTPADLEGAKAFWA